MKRREELVESIRSMKISRKHIGIVGLLAVIALAAAPSILDSTLEIQETSFTTSAQIIQPDNTSNITLGVKTDSDLQFGRMNPGTNFTKYINVTSPQKILVDLKARGNITQFLDYEEQHYFEGRKKMPVTLRAKKPGNYTGVVHVRIRKHNGGISKKWLELKSGY